MSWFFYNKLKNIFDCFIIVDPVIISKFSSVFNRSPFVMDTNVGGCIET